MNHPNKGDKEIEVCGHGKYYNGNGTPESCPVYHIPKAQAGQGGSILVPKAEEKKDCGCGKGEFCTLCMQPGIESSGYAATLPAEEESWEKDIRSILNQKGVDFEWRVEEFKSFYAEKVARIKLQKIKYEDKILKQFKQAIFLLANIEKK